MRESITPSKALGTADKVAAEAGVLLLIMVDEAIQCFQTPSVTLPLAINMDLSISCLLRHPYRLEETMPARDGQMRPS
jgi:hypothetical protein